MIGLPRPDANGGKGDVCLNARSWLNNHQNERSSFSSGVTLAGLRSLPRHYEKSGLDPNLPLPDDIHIFYWIYPYATSVTIREFGMFAPGATFEQAAVYQSLKYYPVAYLCSSQPEYAGLPALSQYRDANLDAEIEIPIDLKRVEDPYWPEAPNDKDNKIFFAGQSAAAAVHARPRRVET